MAKTTLKSLIPLLDSWNALKAPCSFIAENEDGFEQDVQIFGLKGSLNAFFVQQYLRQRYFVLTHREQYENKYFSHEQDVVIVVSSEKEADECESDLQTVFEDEVQIYKLPWWGVLPYRTSAPGSVVFGKRARFLSTLCTLNDRNSKPRVFIITQRSLLSPLPPPSYLKSLTVSVKKGMSFDSLSLSKTLADYGYIRVPKVTVPGEYALRGEVLDIFLPGETYAKRIVFDFDTVEQLKSFDTESQNSKENLDKVIIYPMKEVVWNEELAVKLEEVLNEEDANGIVNNFALYDAKRKGVVQNSEDYGEELPNDGLNNNERSVGKDGVVHLSLTDKAKKEKDRIIAELQVNHQTEGEELFYGVIWDRLYTIMDYIGKDVPMFFYDYDRLVNAEKMLMNEYVVSYRLQRQSLPVLQPKYMLLPFDGLLQTNQKKIFFRTLDTLQNLQDEQNEENNIHNPYHFKIPAENAQSYFGNINYLKEQLQVMQNEGCHIYVFADNANQSLRIKEVLKPFIEVDGIDLYPLQVFPKPLTSGFTVSDEKIVVIQENEIFGRRKAPPSSIRKAQSRKIDTFMELTPGDFVVHVNYGIGRFIGIERVKTINAERDYIKLEYADEEFAFVPIEQVNLVQRYVGSETSTPSLDRIGSKSWQSRKSRVQQKVEEIAEKLIDLYSKRKASRGFAFPKDTEWQAAFEAAFPYEDTPDQYTATQDIKADMEKPVPMDRLVCGDVGYGKTEIAMRAAFKAVMGGKQVAFLAPTTILAEQHYENCLERFKNFPVTIAQLSRFVTPAEQKKIIQRVKEGKVDILVGTHRIIQKDIEFKDLGLMIIDEEQRFGVKDKEKLKVMKNNIDSLAMSATPIPRTLHMSLLNIRDMSLLTTAPQNRQSVETVIEAYNDEKLAEAIRREVDRGGQVFYLHNRVESLEEVRHKLSSLLPEMLIDVAHGQMTSDELDDIFRRFKMGGFHILVATTIIENGIDIPNVNTIIIDRADMYGVSQLYQLRGRVGRSDRKAYAFLFYPENKALSEVAMKRLQVISDFTELGSGFKIAMKDMEIRGAGNLLGKDQSGEVYAVGFEMYINLLNQAIERLSKSDWKEEQEVLLELEYTGFIPNSYIDENETKMEVYKKIAGIKTQNELEMVYDELYDRFGPIPDEVNSLLSISKIRILCRKLDISSLKEKKGVVHIEYSDVSKVNVSKALKLISLNPKAIHLNPANPKEIILSVGTIDLKSKAEFIMEKLEQLG